MIRQAVRAGIVEKASRGPNAPWEVISTSLIRPFSSNSMGSMLTLRQVKEFWEALW